MEDLLHRYRLALALIPDPDAAGDLFMASRSEADLRRRAARWRERHGLPPADANPPLPELDAPQREHALHLARRGKAHRRGTAGLTALAVAVGLAAGGYLLREALTPRLDSDPAFAGAPIATGRGMGSLILAVYRAEVSLSPPGQGSVPDALIAVWWEVTGPAAADAYRLFQPQLSLPNTSRIRTEQYWLNAESTVRYSSRPDRVLGVTLFRVPAPLLRPDALFRLREGRGTEPDFSLDLRLPPPEPAGSAGR